MNNGMRMISVVFLFLMNAFCFGMDAQKKMIKFEVLKNDGSRNKGLHRDIVVNDVAPHADIPTQRNLSATCRAARGQIKIQELEDGRCALDGAMGLRLYQLKGETNDTYARVWEHNFNYAKRVFALADITEGNPGLAKTVFLEGFVPNNRFGLKYQYTENLVKPAIARGEKDFAVALIKANPHGFAGGSDLRRPNMGMFPHGEVCYLIGCYGKVEKVEMKPYIDLCKQQPSRSPLTSDKDHCTIL